MTDRAETPRTEAAVRRTHWPGWIWAVPVAALAIVIWLIARHFAEQGPEVTLTFQTAAGVKADDTKVRYRGMQVGRVQSVVLSNDLGHVVVKARLREEVAGALREGTRFWISGAKPDLGDLSSLKSVITGPSIEMDPGPGKPTKEFAGLEQPPQVMNGTQGIELTLRTGELGKITAGTSVSYRGIEVGKVEEATLAQDGKSFAIKAFVRAPFDVFVHGDTRFWKADSLQLQTGANGLSAQVASLPALISGAIAFETADHSPATPPAKSGDQFPLYDDRGAADAAPVGPQVPFLVRFDGAVGDLKPGAPVRLKGFRIGQVTGVSLAYDAQSGRLQTPVTVEVEPQRLHLTNASPAGDGNWAPQVTDAMERLVKDGLRARLERTPPVVGGKAVVLDFVEAAKPAQLVRGGAAAEIPTAPSSDINEITGEAHAVMAKIDALPIDQIGEDVQRATRRIDHLTASPELEESLANLNRTMANVEQISKTAKRDIGPVVASLRRTAEAAQQAAASADSVLGGSGAEQNRDLPRALEELAGAARSVRELADYLDQHPEALIQGRPEATR